jgi:hypothetical protein
MDQGGTRYYLLGDHLGSTAKVVRASDGAVVASQRYYPFGRMRVATGQQLGPTDKLFTGHQQEAATRGRRSIENKAQDPSLRSTWQRPSSLY